MTNEQNFFNFAAHVGLTKHLGGLKATAELIDLCHIEAHKYVLDVGCGAGATPCFLAERYGCIVVGVDIHPGMVEKSIERARRLGLADRVEFRVADAQSLPFEDGLFDAVISESVTAFPEDKQKSVDEYARLTKPGGYVGLNESTWLKYPPSVEMIAWATQNVGAQVRPLTSDGWAGLLESAGLQDIVVRIYEIDLQNEAKGILGRYGWQEMLRVMGRTLSLYARDPNYRRFVKGVSQGGITPKNLDEYFGYGVYVGRK